MKQITFEELISPFVTTAQEVNLEDWEQEVYREKDVLRLLETVRVKTLEEVANKSKIAIYLNSTEIEQYYLPDLIEDNGSYYQSLSSDRITNDNYVTVDKKSILELSKDSIEV